MYKHIIFDFGGVFLYVDSPGMKTPRTLAMALGADESLVAEAWKSHGNSLATGKVHIKKAMKLIAERAGVTVDIDKAHRRWAKNYSAKKSQINWKLVSYMKLLKKQYSIHMLSDTIDLSEGRRKWKDDLFRNFDVVLLSHEQGVRKPSKEAFLNMLKKISAKPSECVFIDDYQPNVDAANKLGITALKYTTLERLIKDLAKHGVVV
ncbi:MAG: HAD-IA family hydrolase [Candidatus Marsarchaeota archaeon]|jgi:putative hydrolase of the HAD superfamily|nr:HAD-IA family hydrolase [Candidatus Marsarchaeota archaeon]